MVANAERKGDDIQRKGDGIQNEYRPGLERPPGLSSALSKRTQGAERHARERGYRGLQQKVGAMVLPHAVSHVAHDHAGELIEV